MLQQTFLFVRLFIYAAKQKKQHKGRKKPAGIKGKKLLMFFDPEFPDRKHGVVAFILPVGVGTEIFSEDLFGLFGYTSEIDLNGKHLYGRDTWGTIKNSQLPYNKVLERLSRKYPEATIVLAGVRPFRIFGFAFHLWPLIRASQVILPYKESVTFSE